MDANQQHDDQDNTIFFYIFIGMILIGGIVVAVKFIFY